MRSSRFIANGLEFWELSELLELATSMARSFSYPIQKPNGAFFPTSSSIQFRFTLPATLGDRLSLQYTSNLETVFDRWPNSIGYSR